MFLIRGSNLPVLLIIAMYERQQYRETTLLEQIGEFTERYIGNLPRRLKAAGEGHPLTLADSSLAGFENFGSRADIGAVFEIEREVGSFYRGWDDEEEQDLQLPPTFDAEDGKDSDSPEEATNDQEAFSFAPPVPLSKSPVRIEQEVEVPRSRRSSMPSARLSQRAVAFPPARPRRDSVQFEPSPLARLFVRSPEKSSGIADRLRERRQSLVNALAMPISHSQPALSSILSPTRRDPQHGSQAPAPGETPTIPAPSEPRTRYAHQARPSVARIEEGKKLSFRDRNDSPSRPRIPSQGTQIPPPNRTIGKASDVELATTERTEVEGEDRETVKDRLERLDRRQQRIERLLEQLVGDKVEGRS